jgi:chromosomal replication initiator protein
LNTVWPKIKDYLSTKLSSEAYQNWIERTQQADRPVADFLVVQVPDEVSAQWIRQEYDVHVRRAIEELKLPIRGVEYAVAAAAPWQSPKPVQLHQGNGHQNGHSAFAEPLFENSASWLNPRLTFDNYVVGSSNQFAHAAALAVATSPSRSYNPLFLHGGVGIGKTHLMHAIGWSLLASFPGLNVVYTSSERFMNDMITCIKLDRMPQFHRHYRSADVLLIDDIHILVGKERTQEEFFHTFNELYDHRKQIVISSDAAPNQMPGLVERVRSRFAWGLMVDIQAPDLETKMAILEKKADSEGIRLPEDVRIFIATKTKSNVRELEGSLTRLIAVSSLTGQAINMAMAQQSLRHLNAPPEKKISIEGIIRKVGEHFNLTPAQLKMKSNTRLIAYPRQIAMYLVKELTQASLPEIGRAFGGKHHTTVLHSVNKIEQLRQTDENLNRLIQSLIDSFQ